MQKRAPADHDCVDPAEEAFSCSSISLFGCRFGNPAWLVGTLEGEDGTDDAEHLVRREEGALLNELADSKVASRVAEHHFVQALEHRRYPKSSDEKV